MFKCFGNKNFSSNESLERAIKKKYFFINKKEAKESVAKCFILKKMLQWCEDVVGL